MERKASPSRRSAAPAAGNAHVHILRGQRDQAGFTLDFEGRLDGEVFDGGRAEDATFVLGAGQMIEDFESGVRGRSAGEEGEFEATFPEDYRAEHLKGKTVTFSVKIKKVAESRLPELDEELFKTFGVEEGGLEAFRDDVRKNMRRELEAASRNQLKSQVMDQLAALHDLALPHAMVEREIDALRRQMLQQFQMYGAQGLQPDLPADLFREQAERRVKVGLVVNEIVSSKELKADPEQVRERIETMAEGYAEPQQVINWYYSNQEQLEQIQMAVLEDQVVDYVVGQASVEAVVSNYRDVVSGKALEPESAEAEGAAAEAAAPAGQTTADAEESQQNS